MMSLRAGQDRCGRTMYNEILFKANQELEEAKKDNDFIYHERIPDIKVLEPISKVVIAKSTPLPSKLSSKFKGIKFKLSCFIYYYLHYIF